MLSRHLKKRTRAEPGGPWPSLWGFSPRCCVGVVILRGGLRHPGSQSRRCIIQVLIVVCACVIVVCVYGISLLLGSGGHRCSALGMRGFSPRYWAGFAMLGMIVNYSFNGGSALSFLWGLPPHRFAGFVFASSSGLIPHDGVSHLALAKLSFPCSDVPDLLGMVFPTLS